MKRFVLTLAVLGSLAAVSPAAAAPLVVVTDPTPDQTFSGTYTCYEYYYDEFGNQQRREVTCEQQGYVAAGEDGVVACNGNEEITRPDDGTPLQGYIWIGPDSAASNPTAASPGNIIGAGNNHETADGEPTGDSPCPSTE